MKKPILILIICVAALISIIWAYSSGSHFRSMQRAISSVPSFDLLLMDSSTVFNTKQLNLGRPILLMYFSPDCEHCKVQVEAIIKDIDSFKDVQVCMFAPMPFGEIKDFYNTFHLSNFKNIIVAQDYEYAFYKYFKASGFPYIVIYDDRKKLIKLFKGETTIDRVIKAAHS